MQTVRNIPIQKEGAPIEFQSSFSKFGLQKQLDRLRSEGPTGLGIFHSVLSAGFLRVLLGSRASCEVICTPRTPKTKVQKRVGKGEFHQMAKIASNNRSLGNFGLQSNTTAN